MLVASQYVGQMLGDPEEGKVASKQRQNWTKFRNFKYDFNTSQEPSTPDVTSLTATFFILNFLAATQVLKYLERENYQRYTSGIDTQLEYTDFLLERSNQKNNAL